MTLTEVSLSDRYQNRHGSIFLNGVQALVRLTLLQADRDRAAGLNTGGFVSGYRGSPLGTLDSAFAAAAAFTTERDIVVKPAVNEEMAATAVAGSQQITQTPGARVAGVFALWYGKGPGLDRAADAIRHGNYQGSSALGGVVLAVGDDHVAKSSSIVSYSDETVASLQVPLFYPADAAEIVQFGLHGFAVSRHTGSWVALKIVTDVADAARVVSASEWDAKPVFPAIDAPTIGLHNRWPETPLEQEMRQQDFRLPGVRAYVLANGLDRIVSKSVDTRIGIIAAGKSWLDVCEALDLLELDQNRLRELKMALYKPALIWPLEPQRLREFANGLDTIIVVEEKAALIENQVKAILYKSVNPPTVWGKTGRDEAAMFPSTADLTPEGIAAELADCLFAASGDPAVANNARRWREVLQQQSLLAIAPALRKPFFCSGCPHNRSTVLPNDSRASAGIGCHGLAAYSRPNTSSFAQMGGEGVHWMGLSPFTDETHMFANMGDGTYFHSGLLAIRQAISANVNITFKLLYNSAVAMTGGQPVDGEISVLKVIDQLLAEGVKTIAVCTDDPKQYPAGDPVRSRVDRIEHRDELDKLQREMRATKGTSVIIYEQMCATEKRRLRKRGKLEDPKPRVFINERVCEGCGDCSVQSNCLSVEPVETAFGTKRKINQSSCNKDYSCLNGFCPSFVTVEGERSSKSAFRDTSALKRLPVPTDRGDGSHQRVLVAGIGGSGIVTISALVSMAAHISSFKTAVLDQVGMAQKGGAVTSHLHISDKPIHALRIPATCADLVIASDQIVGNARDVMASIDPGRTHVIANSDVAITGDFAQNRDAIPDTTLLTQRLAQRAGASHFFSFPFTRLSEALFGDSIGSNMMMLGAAYQKGWLRMTLEAFDAALTLNAVGAEMNRAAFYWGRQLAIEPGVVFEAAGLTAKVAESVDQLLQGRASILTKFQNEAYGARFRAIMERVQSAEAVVSQKRTLTEAAARSLFKLMAYKDEYEVARLYTDGSFAKSLAREFKPGAKLKFHLAPPLSARRDKRTRHLRKQTFGPWMMLAFQGLTRLKFLRGTIFDPFGYTAERRTERALVGEYEQVLEHLVSRLSKDNIATAVAIASLPLDIRGFGHVKDRAVDLYRERLSNALKTYDGTASSDLRSVA